MFTVVQLSGEKLVEDPNTHQIYKIGFWVIYDCKRNLFIDSAGCSSPFRNNLFYPFTSYEEANKERSRRVALGFSEKRGI